MAVSRERQPRSSVIMWFCPLDGTLLQVANTNADASASPGYFFCSTCSYSSPIVAKVAKKTFPTRKVVDDILGGAAAWYVRERIQFLCPPYNLRLAMFLNLTAYRPLPFYYTGRMLTEQWPLVHLAIITRHILCRYKFVVLTNVSNF